MKKANTSRTISVETLINSYTQTLGIILTVGIMPNLVNIESEPVWAVCEAFQEILVVSLNIVFEMNACNLLYIIFRSSQILCIEKVNIFVIFRKKYLEGAFFSIRADDLRIGWSTAFWLYHYRIIYLLGKNVCLSCIILPIFNFRARE